MIRRVVNVGALELHYLEAGEGPPVLFLHGWPTHAELWRNILPALCGRRAIALDLPGYGRSSKPLDASYSFRFYDGVLTGFLDAIGVDRTGLVVHDIGGPIGLHWLAGNRGRVTDLALLNTLVFPEMSAMVKLFVVSTFLPGIRAVLTSRWGLGAAMRLGVQDRARITDDVAALYQDPFVEAAARKALLKAAHGLHIKGFDTIVEGLGALDVPCRVVYGEDDRILPDVAQTMARVKALVPQAEVTALAGCGHFLQEDQPEVVARHLAAFFDPSVTR